MGATLYTSASPSILHSLRLRLAAYWSMIKDLQTGLLVITAAAGYISACCLNPASANLLHLTGSMFLAVSGSTVLNMFFDRDIDARMPRTIWRPLPSGKIQPYEAALLGMLLSAAGLFWAAILDWRYAAVTALGLFLDVAVYTLWLKRRTPWSILIGGLSGGMPALAGRVLALGRVDLIGILFVAGILCWIPTHILTFSIKHRQDYALAGIPTFPASYGTSFTRKIIALSTVLAVACLAGLGWHLMLPVILRQGLLLLGGALIALVAFSVVRPGRRLNFILYKGASIFMLSAMILIIAGGL